VGGSLKYKGLTADASGIIIDTSSGREQAIQQISSFQTQTEEESERRAKIR
jgi:hypothetical protein